MAVKYTIGQVARPLRSNLSVWNRRAYLPFAASFFIMLLLTMPVSSAGAKNLFVDVAGVRGRCSDSVPYADNVQARPWCTIQRAADIVKPGDTVIVENGTYTSMGSKNYMVYLTRGGTLSAWITFKAANKWGAVLDGGSQGQVEHGPNNFGWMVGAGSASYIRIEGFEIKNFAYGGIGTEIGATGTNMVFYGNNIHDIGRYFLTSIECSGDPSNGRSGMGSGSSASYITVDSNIIYNIGRFPGGSCSGWSDYNSDHGLYIQASHVTVINNIFYNCTSGWPIQITSDGAKAITDWNVVNNTFYGANPREDGHIILWGIEKDITIANNVSYGSQGYFINSHWQHKSKTNIYIINNLVYGANVLDQGGSEYHLSNNITGKDPLFADLAKKDFHLRSGSPAIDKGSPRDAPSYDNDHNIRPQGLAYDIGAYEYMGK